MEFSVVLPSGRLLKIYLKTNVLKGKYLLSQVYSECQINDDTNKEYFGLRYPDKEDAGMNWLKPEDNLKSLSYLSSGFKTRALNLQLGVRFFPNNPDLVFSSNEIRLIFRQYMKNLLVDEHLGCDIKTHAMLDAFLVQAELGDYIFQTKGKYYKDIADLEVHAPTVLSCGTSLTEKQYHALVKQYHEKLRGIRSGQADIMYLTQIQKVPSYGSNIHSICDKTNDSYFLAISEKGIAFVYDSFIKKYVAPIRIETYGWSDLIYHEVVSNTLKLGFFPQGNEFVERKIKIKNKYSKKGAYRVQVEINKFKEVCFDTIDCQNIFDSRKNATKFYTTRIPKKTTLFSKKFSSVKRSFRTSFRDSKRSNSVRENLTISDEKEVRRIHSES